MSQVFGETTPWCGADIGPEIILLMSPTTNLACTHDSFVTSHKKGKFRTSLGLYVHQL